MAFYNSFSYSCDKIKLKGKLQKNIYKDMPFYRNIRTWVYAFLPEWIECVEEFENLYAFKYRYHFSLRVVGDKEGVFVVQEQYNGDFKEQKTRPELFLIEYNPNKSGASIYSEFCNHFIFRFTELVSFDIAYDLPDYSVSDVFIDTRADIMTYGKTFNKTLYIAPKDKLCGRVKIYNKDKERELVGEQTEKKLRIEASIKCKGLDFSTVHINGTLLELLSVTVDHLNSVKIKKRSEACDDWKLYALSRLSPEDLTVVLSMMSSTPRAKYRKLISEATYFTLDIDVPTLVGHIIDILKPWERRFKIS